MRIGVSEAYEPEEETSFPRNKIDMAHLIVSVELARDA